MCTATNSLVQYIKNNFGRSGVELQPELTHLAVLQRKDLEPYIGHISAIKSCL